MNSIWTRSIATFVLCTFAITALATTPQQRNKLNELNDKTKEAGKLYSADKMDDAAKLINEVQKELAKVLEDRSSPALQRTAEPIYQRLVRAHALLELEGVSLDPLKSWEELIGKDKAGSPGGKPVSFKDEVAPILVSKCGVCHVSATRGKFSMASYEVLMQGPAAGKVVFPGAATGSRIIEVIEGGDMPPNGGKVPPEQLATLKRWIEQGARFDGQDPKVRLNELAKPTDADNGGAPKLLMKTGKETVSFARDIAPVLRENCVGCHIGGQQASGNFRMDSFNQLLRGGDSGPVISPPKDADSLLIKKLKGQSGQRMPAGGRPPLSDEQIEKIATWIRENATFDGPKPDTNINTVINTAWANDAKHSDLLQRRSERAIEKWKRVLPNDEPSIAKSDELFVVGNLPEFRLEEIHQELEKAITTVKKQFSAPNNQPLVRGGIAVFVLKSRYDYSEFGKMTEKRELPKQWQGHWSADPLDVYGVISGEKSTEAPMASVALQVVTAAYLGSHAEVPYWFAEGVARNMVINNHKKDDQRVKIWAASMGQAAQRITDSKALLQGNLDEEAGGIVGMAIANTMMARNNRTRFNALITKLREGQGFSEAMTATFGKPEEFLKAWVGK